MYKVLTNNPMTQRYFATESESGNVHVTWVEGGYRSVLVAARDMVHLGWKLLNHPLASSIKPNQTPYKTLILSQAGMLDYQSLAVIEAALAAVEKLGTFAGSDDILADLQLVDLDLCRGII